MKLEVVVPEAYMGDVMGDMNKRRGEYLEWNLINMESKY